jgi:hypothetical protein
VLALVRLLAGVCPRMDCQRAPLDEALATSRVVARIGALVCVDSVVALEVRFAVEALLTVSAIHDAPVAGDSKATHLATLGPVARKRARGGLVVNKLKEFHDAPWCLSTCR